MWAFAAKEEIPREAGGVERVGRGTFFECHTTSQRITLQLSVFALLFFSTTSLFTLIDFVWCFFFFKFDLILFRDFSVRLLKYTMIIINIVICITWKVLTLTRIGGKMKGGGGKQKMADDAGKSRDHQTISACLFMWRERWSDLENARSQRRHWNGRSPVCFLKCRVSSSLLANFHPQPFQLHWYGFSPVWVLKWAFKWDDLLYVLEHPGYEHVWRVTFSRPRDRRPRRVFTFGAGRNVIDGGTKLVMPSTDGDDGIDVPLIVSWSPNWLFRIALIIGAADDIFGLTTTSDEMSRNP